MSTFTFAAVEARKLAGEVVPMDASPAGEGKLAFTLRLPIGVVGAISPFNFPLNLVAHKVAPALAAGCAVVLKPASATPLSALFLAGLEEEAGLPPGWLNVVAGSSSEIGDVLVEDERVKLITFTGSGDVGWRIAERAPAEAREARARERNARDRLRRRARRHAPAKLAANAFSFAGQSCISVQRIFVMAEAWDAFVADFVPKVEALQVGDPADDVDRRRPRDQRRRARPHPRLGPRVERRGPHRRGHERRRVDPPDRDRGPRAGRTRCSAKRCSGPS